jgi:hypothetical protein
MTPAVELLESMGLDPGVKWRDHRPAAANDNADEFGMIPPRPSVHTGVMWVQVDGKPTGNPLLSRPMTACEAVY